MFLTRALPVINRVLAALKTHCFRAETAILDKRKVEPTVRVSEERVYQYAWFYHLKYVTRRILTNNTDKILVVATSIGNRKGCAALHKRVEDIVTETMTARAPE